MEYITDPLEDLEMGLEKITRWIAMRVEVQEVTGFELISVP